MITAPKSLCGRSLLIGVIIGISTALGCAMAGKPDDPPSRDSTLPGKSQLAIVLDGSLGLNVVDGNGRPVQPCALPGTRGNEKLPACRGITNTNLQDVVPLSIVSHTGSNCRTIVMGGVARTYCW